MQSQTVMWNSNWEAPGKKYVHKSVDPFFALRKFLQVQSLMLIISKYLGLHCGWSRMFFLLSSDLQIRKKPLGRCWAVWLAPMGITRLEINSPWCAPDKGTKQFLLLQRTHLSCSHSLWCRNGRLQIRPVPQAC